MLEAYLRELEDEMSQRLSHEDVQARLAEIAAHLNESVAAYHELGLDEREALEAMGEPRRLARSLAESATEMAHRRRLLSAGLSFLGLGVAVAVRDAYGPGSLTALAALGAHVGLYGTAYGAFRARRRAPVPLAAVALVVVLPIALLRAGIYRELPLPGSAQPVEGLGEASLVYRPYGPERNLECVSIGGRTYRVADLLKNEVPLARRLVHQSPLALVDGALHLALVGSVDAAGAWLGIAVLAARRRRRNFA